MSIKKIPLPLRPPLVPLLSLSLSFPHPPSLHKANPPGTQPTSSQSPSTLREPQARVTYLDDIVGNPSSCCPAWGLQNIIPIPCRRRPLSAEKFFRFFQSENARSQASLFDYEKTPNTLLVDSCSEQPSLHCGSSEERRGEDPVKRGWWTAQGRDRRLGWQPLEEDDPREVLEEGIGGVKAVGQRRGEMPAADAAAPGMGGRWKGCS